MSRVHDMGGRFGDGAIVPEAEDDSVFHEDWHGRALVGTSINIVRLNANFSFICN